MLLVAGLVVGLGAAACGGSVASEDGAPAADPAESDITKLVNDLSAKQQRDALDSLNGACGDAWCEGDLQIDFKKITCSFKSKTCVVSANVIDEGKKDGPSDDLVYPRTCKIKGVASYKEIIEYNNFGGADLTTPGFDKADACATDLENGIKVRP
jgi:hypothetical protein